MTSMSSDLLVLEGFGKADPVPIPQSDSHALRLVIVGRSARRITDVGRFYVSLSPGHYSELLFVLGQARGRVHGRISHPL